MEQITCHMQACENKARTKNPFVVDPAILQAVAAKAAAESSQPEAAS